MLENQRCLRFLFCSFFLVIKVWCIPCPQCNATTNNSVRILGVLSCFKQSWGAGCRGLVSSLLSWSWHFIRNLVGHMIPMGVPQDGSQFHRSSCDWDRTGKKSEGVGRMGCVSVEIFSSNMSKCCYLKHFIVNIMLVILSLLCLCIFKKGHAYHNDSFI